jgi:uncharacterized membrane protein YjgN (DUF898 family)
MILLQAAIAAGIFLSTLFGILLLFGVPILTNIIAKMWRRADSRQLQKNAAAEGIKRTKLPTDWGVLISSVIISILIIVVVCVVIFIVLSGLIPGFV